MEMFNNLKRFLLNILIFTTDIILAFKIFKVISPRILDHNLLSELLGDMSFFWMLLTMTFIKMIIITVRYGMKWSVICFFLQSVLLICTIYLNIYIVYGPLTVTGNKENFFLGMIVLALLPLRLILGLFARILSILVLYGAMIIPFIVSIKVKLRYDSKQLKIKLAEQKRLEKERERILKSERDLIFEIIDERAKMDLIIDNPQTEAIPHYFSKDNRYILDDNLAINKHDYTPIYMANEDKYYYYKNSIQKLCNEFKDILGYNLCDVKDTHEFLLSFKKDIENYLNNINLSTNAVGIRKKEQSFIIRQRKYFIEYYLNQRFEMIIKDNYSIKLGYEGEEFVNNTLAIHHNLINLSNIRVEIDGRSVECDNIILSTKGIFILEVKNIGSSGKFKIIIEKDGRWQKKYESSQEVESMDSATSQNNAHVAYISRLLEKECVDINFDFGLNGIVVISNNNVSIENHSMYQTVLRADNVYNYISSFPTIYTKEQLEIIKQVLLKHNLDPKGYPVYQHIDELIQNINQMLNVLRKGAAILKEHNEEVEDIEKVQPVLNESQPGSSTKQIQSTSKQKRPRHFKNYCEGINEVPDWLKSEEWITKRGFKVGGEPWGMFITVRCQETLLYSLHEAIPHIPGADLHFKGHYFQELSHIPYYLQPLSYFQMHGLVPQGPVVAKLLVNDQFFVDYYTIPSILNLSQRQSLQADWVLQFNGEIYSCDPEQLPSSLKYKKQLDEAGLPVPEKVAAYLFTGNDFVPLYRFPKPKPTLKVVSKVF